MLARNVSAAVALTGLAVVAGVGTCGFVAPLSNDRVAELSISTLGLEIFLATLAFALARLGATPPAARLGLGPSRFSGRLLVLSVVGALGLSFAIDTALHLSGVRPDSVLEELDQLLRGARGGALVWALLGLAVAPALGEELLCRGLVQRGAEPVLGGPLAVVVSSVLFGALHMEWIQGGATAVLGLYLGALTWVSGSLRPAILCHAANNSFAIALAVTAPEAAASLDPADPRAGGPSLALGALGLLATAIAVARIGAVAPGPRGEVSRLQSTRGLDDS